MWPKRKLQFVKSAFLTYPRYSWENLRVWGHFLRLIFCLVTRRHLCVCVCVRLCVRILQNDRKCRKGKKPSALNVAFSVDNCYRLGGYPHDQFEHTTF